MYTKKLITTLAFTSLATAGFVSAQTPPPPPPGEGEGRPGMFQRFREEMHDNRQDRREDRKEDRQEFKDEMKGMKEDFKEGMKDLRDWRKASGTATGTRPTPFKDLRDKFQEERKEFMNDRRPPQMSATATAAIALKLGITTEALQAKLASGTKLKELIKDKISPEEMKNILPPRVATFTKQVEERGFFNNLRSSLFGHRQEMVEEKTNEFGEIVVSTTTISVPATPFWKRFFGF